MNIFQRRTKVTEDINNRAQVFVRLAHAAIESLRSPDNNDSRLAPSFVTGYHGFHAEVFPFDNSRWVPNPNYKPELSSEEHAKPENRELQTGFSQINEIDEMCRICVVECQDAWDDCAGEPETWNLEMIPQDLFLSGTEKDITAFFEAKFKREADRANENAFQGKWAQLFHYYTAEELRMAADARDQAVREMSEKTWNNATFFDTYLNKIRGKVNDMS